MNHIVKVFPPSLVALDDVSVDFRKGEIHAIVGENGAGKSTLMKALYGMQPAVSGEILYNGSKVRFTDPGEAIKAGIGMVHQEIMLVPQYTVWENVVLGSEPVLLFDRLDTKKARQLVKEKINEFHFNLDADAKVDDISIAARQKVEILKLLFRNVTVLIMDEPTSVLTPQEIPQLFDELKRLRDNGHTILFISHHLDEVLDLSDRITVLRKGKKIGTMDAGAASKAGLAQMMVGREVIFEALLKEQRAGDGLFKVEHLNYTDSNKRQRLIDINLQVHAGEIVGVAGVEGNGQLELVNVIMGLIEPTSGTIEVQGADITKSSILERRRRIAFVSQDRTNMGSSVNARITENVIMTHHRLNPRFTQWNGRILDLRQADMFTNEVRDRFDVQMTSPENPFKSLSGGNQQKVILGRELMLEAPFILLDQPTRGLDVGSIEYVHRRILDMRAQMRAILLISADLEELFRITDRLVVMHRGRVVAELETRNTNITEVGYLMLEGAAYGA
ncbi:MAG TPA: ABC transporter ATP-binding protein [Anaerolineaceae bacterium]|nr:ABC transporter ATP-binding protein [Anaerolineaceae bacterium]